MTAFILDNFSSVTSNIKAQLKLVILGFSEDESIFSKDVLNSDNVKFIAYNRLA
jgi:hypothetical protein